MEQIVEQILALLGQLQPDEAKAVIAKLAEQVAGEGEQQGQPAMQGGSPMGGPNGVPVQ